MQRKGIETSLAERKVIQERSQAGENDRQIAQRMGCSVWTVRKWRRRGQQHGAAGLVTKRGRPPSGALSSYGGAMQQQIQQMREAHPGWGAITMRIELQRAAKDSPLPSRARIAAYLKEQGKVRGYHRHRAVTPEAKPQAREVHEVWEMDAAGEEDLPGLGNVSLINISDVVSRVKVGCIAYQGRESTLSSTEYQAALRQVFTEYGLPQVMSLDHGPAFFDNTCPSPFPTRLHLWLVALGVRVYFITKAPPLEHAIIERSHPTLHGQIAQTQPWESLAQLQQVCDQRRQFLNQDYPSVTFHQHAPYQVFPQARHTPRPYRREWEADMLDMQRVYQLLQCGCWYRNSNAQGCFSLGRQRFNMGHACGKTTLTIHFDAKSCEFVCQAPGSDTPRRFTPTCLSKAILMDETDLITALLPYQPSLPFAFQPMHLSALVPR